MPMNSKQKSQTATRLRATALAAALLCAPDVRSLAAEPVPALATNAPAPEWLTQPMALVDAVNIALRQNARILKGKQDLEATAGIVVQTKAIAMPRLQGIAGYTHD